MRWVSGSVDREQFPTVAEWERLERENAEMRLQLIDMGYVLRNALGHIHRRHRAVRADVSQALSELPSP